VKREKEINYLICFAKVSIVFSICFIRVSGFFPSFTYSRYARLCDGGSFSNYVFALIFLFNASWKSSETATCGFVLCVGIIISSKK